MEIWENKKIYAVYKRFCAILAESELTPEEQRYLFEHYLNYHKKAYPELNNADADK